MKNKIAIAAAFVAASSFSTAEIVVNDFLSFEGFVDMSYATTDYEIGGADQNQNTFQIDQVEISWLFDFDTVTAQIDLAYEGSDSARTPGDGGEVEQAFVTYHFDNGSAITAGRFASMLGFEAFEPTGLYQYSFAYNMTNVGPATGVLPGYYQGVKYTYETDSTFFGIAVVDSVTNGTINQLGGNNGNSSYGIEAAASVNFDNGLTFFVGGVFENVEGAAGVDNDFYALNTYVTFETGAWIFAAELTYGESEGVLVLPGVAFATGPHAGSDEEVLQGLLMANFAYSENASITGRISYTQHEADYTRTGGPAAAPGPADDADFIKYTLAHGYAFTDNLFLVTEISVVDGELLDVDHEGLEGAVELIFSF